MSPLRRFFADVAKIPAVVFDLRRWTTGLRQIGRAILHLLRLLHRDGRRQPGPSTSGCCLDIPDVYRRPDPLIYAQYYLMKMGLAVTWDNPDIQLFEPHAGAPGGLGTPVSSEGVQPNHAYKVQVRVWNGSYDAPA